MSIFDGGSIEKNFLVTEFSSFTTNSTSSPETSIEFDCANSTLTE